MCALREFGPRRCGRLRDVNGDAEMARKFMRFRAGKQAHRRLARVQSLQGIFTEFSC
jgi:hypothetical protein